MHSAEDEKRDGPAKEAVEEKKGNDPARPKFGDSKLKRKIQARVNSLMNPDLSSRRREQLEAALAKESKLYESLKLIRMDYPEFLKKLESKERIAYWVDQLKQLSVSKELSQLEIIMCWSTILEILSKETNPIKYQENLKILEDMGTPDFFARMLLGRGTKEYLENEEKYRESKEQHEKIQAQYEKIPVPEEENKEQDAKSKEKYEESKAQYEKSKAQYAKSKAQYEENKKQYAAVGEEVVKHLLNDHLSGRMDDKLMVGPNGIADQAKLAMYSYVRGLAITGAGIDEEEQKQLQKINEDSHTSLKSKWRRALGEFDRAYDRKEAKSDLANDMMHPLSFLLAADPLPDFIAKKDILRLCLYAPSYLDNLEFNASLFKKIGDLGAFEERLKIEVGRAIEQGIFPEEHLSVIENSKFYKNLIVAKQEKAIEEIREITGKHDDEIKIVEANLAFVAKFLDDVEASLFYNTQMRDCYAILKTGKLARIGMNENEHKQFVDYIDGIQSEYLEAAEQDARIEQVNKINDNILAIKYKKLEQIKKSIKDRPGWRSNPNLNEAYQQVKKCQAEIIEMRERIIHINSELQSYKELHSDRNDESEMHAMIGNKIKEFRTKKRRSPFKTTSKIGKILYFSIMTRAQIGVGNPTREYLNQLYSDPALNAFLNSSWKKREKFKNNIALIEKDLVAAKVNALVTSDMEASQEISGSERNYKKYSDKRIASIRKEIMECKTETAQAKTIEHWIYVLDKAYKDENTFTARIIYNAFSDPAIKELMEKKFVSTLISAEAKGIFSVIQVEIERELVEEKLAKQKAMQEEKAEEKPGDALQRKKEAAIALISGRLIEVYESDHTFCDSMNKLKDCLSKLPQGKNLDKNMLGQLYCDDIKAGNYEGFLEKIATPFSEMKEVKDLDGCIANMEALLEDFQAPNFQKVLDSLRLLTFDFTWATELIKDYELNDIPEIKGSYPSGLAQEVIQPVQRTPRYGLLLEDIIRNANSLLKLYEEENLPENEEKIENLRKNKEKIEKIRELIGKLEIEKSKISEFISREINKKVDMAQLNRLIAYKLYKDSNKLNASRAQELRSGPIAVIRNSTSITETASALAAIQANFGIPTNHYLADVYIFQAKEDIMALHEEDHLVKLNREIAIELFQASKDIHPKTQKKIIDFAIKLCDSPPKEPREILNFLNEINLRRVDKLTHHQIHRRLLKGKITDYLASRTTQSVQEIAPEVGKLEQDYDLETFNLKMQQHLESLVVQWQAEGDAHKLKGDEKKHNADRIKLVSDALVAIKKFPNPTLKDIVYLSLANHLSGLHDPKIELSDRTLESAQTITRLVTPKFSVVSDDKHDKPLKLEITTSASTTGNAFKSLFVVNIDKMKQAIREEMKEDLDDSPSHVLRHLIEYLKCIRDECTIQELEPWAEKQTDIIHQRKVAVDEAIGALTTGDLSAIEVLENKLNAMTTPPVTLYAKSQSFVTRQTTKSQRTEELSAGTRKILSDIRAVKEEYIRPRLEAGKQAEEKEKQGREAVLQVQRQVEEQGKREKEEKERQRVEAERVEEEKRLELERAEAEKRLALERAEEERKLVEQEKKLAEQQQKDQENKRAMKKSFVEGAQAVPAEGKNAIKGTQDILRTFKKHVPPRFAAEQLGYGELKQYSKELKYDASDNWERISSENIRNVTKRRNSELKAVVNEDVALAEGKVNVYESKGNHAQISVARESNHLIINVVKEPDGYAEQKDPEKFQTDLIIAERMIRLWVATYGNSEKQRIPISDSANKSRMMAQIVVCKAYGLAYDVPDFSAHHSGFSLDADDNPAIRDAVTAFKVTIMELGTQKIRSPIQTFMISPQKLAKLEGRVEALAAHVQDAAADEKQAYAEKIASLRQLIASAKEGKVDVDAFKAASQALAADEKAIQTPVEEKKLGFPPP